MTGLVAGITGDSPRLACSSANVFLLANGSPVSCQGGFGLLRSELKLRAPDSSEFDDEYQRPISRNETRLRLGGGASVL